MSTIHIPGDLLAVEVHKDTDYWVTNVPYVNSYLCWEDELGYEKFYILPTDFWEYVGLASELVKFVRKIKMSLMTGTGGFTEETEYMFHLPELFKASNLDSTKEYCILRKV